MKLRVILYQIYAYAYFLITYKGAIASLRGTS